MEGTGEVVVVVEDVEDGIVEAVVDVVEGTGEVDVVVLKFGSNGIKSKNMYIF